MKQKAEKQRQSKGQVTDATQRIQLKNSGLGSAKETQQRMTIKKYDRKFQRVD
jgi:hypothetical protein